MTKETEREADAGKKRRSCGVAALLIAGLVLISSGGRVSPTRGGRSGGALGGGVSPIRWPTDEEGGGGAGAQGMWSQGARRKRVGTLEQVEGRGWKMP
jgi:hypothetical protein